MKIDAHNVTMMMMMVRIKMMMMMVAMMTMLIFEAAILIVICNLNADIYRYKLGPRMMMMARLIMSITMITRMMR